MIKIVESLENTGYYFFYLNDVKIFSNHLRIYDIDYIKDFFSKMATLSECDIKTRLYEIIKMTEC